MTSYSRSFPSFAQKDGTMPSVGTQLAFRNLLEKNLKTNKKIERLLPPILNIPVVPMEQETLVQNALRDLRGFSYRELFKWKKTLKDLPRAVSLSCLIMASGLKMHVSQYPHTIPLCRVIKNHFCNAEGPDAYEEFFSEYATDFDRKMYRRVEYTPLQHILMKAKDACSKTAPDGTEAKCLTREFPSVNIFPRFDKPKESKMYLCNEESPDEEALSRFRKGARDFLEKYSPEDLPVPNIKACYSLGPNLYSDGTLKKRDYQEPEISWNETWQYVHFWSTPTSKREVWIPNKTYKMCSSWWHFLSNPLVNDCEELVGNDQPTDVRKSLHARFRPCKKIDLKGFGLQFPREFIKILMDEFVSRYDHDWIKTMRDLTVDQFDRLNITMPDGSHFWPNRGVGLGYFSNLMTIAVRICLEDCYIVKMFNDDILVDENDYEKAISKLTSYSFIINEKKSGELYYCAPYFMNMSMHKTGSLRYQDAQGPMSAVMLGKHHYQRKSTFLMVPMPYKWKAMYHYERIFGWECQPGECFDHPTKWGLNYSATEYVGWVKGGLLRKFRSPKSGDITEYRMKSIAFPFMEEKDNHFNETRFKSRRFKNKRWYTMTDEYLNPKVEEVTWINEVNHQNFLGSEQMPSWYDLNLLYMYKYSTGKILRGLSREDVLHAFERYSLFRDPIGTMKYGGGVITSPFHKTPAISGIMGEIYDLIRDAKIGNMDICKKNSIQNSAAQIEAGESMIREQDEYSRILGDALVKGPKIDTDVEYKSTYNDTFEAYASESDIDYYPSGVEDEDDLYLDNL